MWMSFQLALDIALGSSNILDQFQRRGQFKAGHLPKVGHLPIESQVKNITAPYGCQGHSLANLIYPNPGIWEPAIPPYTHSPNPLTGGSVPTTSISSRKSLADWEVLLQMRRFDVLMSAIQLTQFLTNPIIGI